MYFSYFARAQLHPDVVSGELHMVSIALHQPQWLPDIEKDPRLAPSRDIFDGYKSGALVINEYCWRYIQDVKHCVNAGRILTLYENAVLCCYETTDKFCHRQALRAWIKGETGIDIPELPKPRKSHTQLDLFGGTDGDSAEGPIK